MKRKAKPTPPVYSYAILPDGTVLPIPQCRGYIRRSDGQVEVYNMHPDSSSEDKRALVLLPTGATLVTNWTHPDHA